MYPSKKQKKLLLSILLILLFASSRSFIPTEIQKILFSQNPPPPQALNSAGKQTNTEIKFIKVIRVIDGDTIIIEGGKKLRYIGVNAPESKDPRRTIQCFGKEANERNKQLVEGKTVRIEKDVSETDKFGRLLRYVYIDDSLINEQLVSEGYAFASSYPPDVKYQERLKAAELDARENKRGLWDNCNIKNVNKNSIYLQECFQFSQLTHLSPNHFLLK